MQTVQNIPENKPKRYCQFMMTRGKKFGKQCGSRIITDNQYCSEHTRVLRRRDDIIKRIELENKNTNVLSN